MRVTKKPSKKQSPNSKLSGLIVLLILSSLLLAAFFLKDYNPALQQEAEGFTKLKQDFLDLQKEFNKIDQGWVYHEGCVGAGGVFDRDKASECSLSIRNLDKNLDLVRFDFYSSWLRNLNDSRYFNSSSIKKIDSTTYSLDSISFPLSSCSLTYIVQGTQNVKNGIALACSATAHYFHFPRTDR